MGWGLGPETSTTGVEGNEERRSSREDYGVERGLSFRNCW